MSIDVPLFGLFCLSTVIGPNLDPKTVHSRYQILFPFYQLLRTLLSLLSLLHHLCH